MCVCVCVVVVVVIWDSIKVVFDYRNFCGSKLYLWAAQQRALNKSRCFHEQQRMKQVEELEFDRVHVC